MTERASSHLENGAGQSLGELVAVALSDITRLVRCEFDLAKLELRADARRLGLAAALLVIAAFAGCLVLVLLCFALAYGLITLGIWSWAAFLIVAGGCVLLAGIAGLIVARKVRRISGLRKTRESVHGDLTLLRRDEPAAPPATTSG
jgi:uncharacterized membrane protein YqjE